MKRNKRTQEEKDKRHNKTSNDLKYQVVLVCLHHAGKGLQGILQKRKQLSIHYFSEVIIIFPGEFSVCACYATCTKSKHSQRLRFNLRACWQNQNIQLKYCFDIYVLYVMCISTLQIRNIICMAMTEEEGIRRINNF